MTALAAVGAGVASSWLTAGIDPMDWYKSELLAPQGARNLVLGHYRSNNHVITFFQVPFENCTDLGIGVVGDSERNFHRFHRLIGMELPNHSVFCFRRVWEILCSRGGPALFCGGVIR